MKLLYYKDRELYMFLLTEYRLSCHMFRYWFHDLDTYSLKQIYNMWARMIELERILF